MNKSLKIKTITIRLEDLSYNEYCNYLLESYSQDRIIPYNSQEQQGSQGEIVRNASGKERLKISKESGDRNKEIGFIAHLPSENIYFFNRDLISHGGVAYRLGFGFAREDAVEDSICGVLYMNTNEIHISDFSTMPELRNPEGENKEKLKACFRKSLMNPIIKRE